MKKSQEEWFGIIVVASILGMKPIGKPERRLGTRKG
jgi:hypothetical protein